MASLSSASLATCSAEGAFGSSESLQNLRHAFISAAQNGITVLASSGDGGSANDKKTPVSEIVEIMSKPEISFTTTPERILPFAQFLHRTGRLKHEPKRWTDLFFPEIHGQAGS